MTDAVRETPVLEGVVDNTNGHGPVPSPRGSVLSPERAARLEECEAIIDRGLLTFQEVGNALRTIQTEKLWVDHYGSFDAYLDQRWGFQAGHANAIIRAVDQAEKLAELAERSVETSPGTLFPENERQLRGLARLGSSELQWEAWTRAVGLARGEQPTRDHIEAAVRLVRQDREPKDETPVRVLKPRGRGTVKIGLPLENAARAMRGFYTYTELKCLALLITMRDRG